MQEKEDIGYWGIIKLVWPLALGMMNNAIMQFTDRAFLSRYSMSALEAILPASMLSLILLGFFQMVVAYSGTFVAQYHGAKDERMCSASFRAGVVIALISGILLFCSLPLGSLAFDLSGHSDEVRRLENGYFGICTSGGIFLLLQMAVSSYFTGRGKTRLVFAINLLGNIFNILLDPILIFGMFGLPSLGVSGAALATVLSMVLQCVLFAYCMFRERIEHRPWRVDLADKRFWGLVLRVLRFGLPSGAYSILNISSFTIFVFITGRVSDVAFAVSNACFTINYLFFTPMEGMGLGAATLVAQSQGRGDSASARKYAWRMVAMGAVLAFVFSVLSLIFYKPLLSIFASAVDPSHIDEFMDTGFILFLIMAAWQVFDGTDIVLSGALKGAGDTKFVMILLFVVAYVLWLPLVIITARYISNTIPALWSTMIMYVVITSVASAIRWHRGRWEKITVLMDK